MTPADFIRFVRGIATENNFSLENIIFGGDHLGPNVWQNEPSESAMEKSCTLIRDYIQAGYQKIHLDCSMRLADDPEGALDPYVSATRASLLAKTAEDSRIDGYPLPQYVIGTEVPVPGGATEHEEGIKVTTVEDVKRTIDITHDAFIKQGLGSAWERVLAVVVQPGVEFGDDFVLKYDPKKTRGLVHFIEGQPLVFEAHSTDYQTQLSLQNLVRDHFAILKVGPELTFAYREAIFALAQVENELYPLDLRSNLIEVLDDVMIHNPEHWQRYIHGTPEHIHFARKYGLSDRIRYYWMYPQVQAAMNEMLKNLEAKPIPAHLLKQYFPEIKEQVFENKPYLAPAGLIIYKIQEALRKYKSACE